MKLNRYNNITTRKKMTQVYPLAKEQIQKIEDSRTHTLNPRLGNQVTSTVFDNPSAYQSESDIRFNITDDNPAKVKKILSLKALESENDQYFVEYYFSQATAGIVINLFHLFFGPLILIPLRMIYGKFLLNAMVFNLSKLYFLGDFTNWL